MNDIMNHLYSEEIITVNCESFKEHNSPHSRSLNLDKLSKTLHFSFEIDVNEWFGSCDIFNIIGNDVSL